MRESGGLKGELSSEGEEGEGGGGERQFPLNELGSVHT